MMTFYVGQNNVSVKSYLSKYMLNDNCNEYKFGIILGSGYLN